jgi:hypothetical protein
MLHCCREVCLQLLQLVKDVCQLLGSFIPQLQLFHNMLKICQFLFSSSLELHYG